MNIKKYTFFNFSLLYYDRHTPHATFQQESVR